MIMIEVREVKPDGTVETSVEERTEEFKKRAAALIDAAYMHGVNDQAKLEKARRERTELPKGLLEKALDTLSSDLLALDYTWRDKEQIEELDRSIDMAIRGLKLWAEIKSRYESARNNYQGFQLTEAMIRKYLDTLMEGEARFPEEGENEHE